MVVVDWFPMGGPIFGASSKINVAYYDALTSMTKMCSIAETKDAFSKRAACLKQNIISHLWNDDAGIMRMSDTASLAGICQDANAYAITTGISPLHVESKNILATPKGKNLPLAFQGLERWDEKKVVSPYASGFAAEALFECNHGQAAVGMIDRVWGVMADKTSPNYSGGHWEAMKPDGSPLTDDTSLMHGWSTWPVYLLPRYLAGISPLEPGWTRWKVQPVLAGLQNVDVSLSTAAGRIEVSLQVQESLGTGTIALKVPIGTVAETFAPLGWVITPPEGVGLSHSGSQSIVGKEDIAMVRIQITGNAGSQIATEVQQAGDFPSNCALEKASVGGCMRKFSILKRILRWLS